MAGVLYIEQFYYPDGWGGAQIPRDITVYLQQAGYEVTVLCGKDQYIPIGEQSADPAESGIRIRRLWKFPGKRIHSFKALRQAFFCVCALPQLFLRTAPALYMAQTNPPLIVPLAAIAAKWRRRPLLLVAQDLYPDALIALGVLSEKGVAGRLLGRLFRWAYRHAAGVICVGAKMKERLIQKGVSASRIRIISNWATGPEIVAKNQESEAQLREAWGLQDKRVALYTGNLGLGHEFKTLLDATQSAVKRGVDLTLVFVGQGSRLEEVRRDVDGKSLHAHVVFRDPVASEMLPALMAISTLSIVTLRPGFEGLIVPSKVLGYMARALPILYVGPPGDISEIIGQSGCGFCCENEDSEGVARILERMTTETELLQVMGRQGQAYYRVNLAKERALARYLEAVRDCLND